VKKTELFAVCSIVVATSFVFSMAAPLVPLMAVSLGASPGMLGLLMGVAAIGALLAAIPSGFITRRFGARIPILLAIFLVGASCLSLFIAPIFTNLFFTLTFFELGRTIFTVSSQYHVGGLPGTRDSSVNFGWYGTAAAVGQMIGPTLSGLSIDHLGYRATWLIMAVIVILTGAAVPYLMHKNKRRDGETDTGSRVGAQGTSSAETGSGSSRGETDRKQARKMVNSVTLVGILTSFIILFTVGTRKTFYPLYVQELGFSASIIGIMLSLRALTSVLTRMMITPATRVLGGRFSTLIICMFALAFGVGSTPLCRSIPTLALNSIFIGLGAGLAFPLSQATVFDSVEPSKRSVAMGVRLSGNRLAELVNPLFFGFLIQYTTLSTAFVFGGIVLFLVTVPILLWWMRHGYR